MGAAIYHFATKRGDNYVTIPVLARLQSNPQAIQFTVRSKHAQASQSIVTACSELFV